MAEILDSDASLLKAVADVMTRKARIMLLSRKALLLGRGDNLRVPEKAGCAVMIED
jgi:hypothetical protein